MLLILYKIFIIPYTILLLYPMFIGFGREQLPFHLVRFSPIISTIEFIQNAQNTQTIIINLLGNIIMFIPFGLLRWINHKYNNFNTLIFHFLSTMVILEALQYFTKMGVFDIDDLLLNSLGIWIGYYVAHQLTPINKKM